MTLTQGNVQKFEVAGGAVENSGKIAFNGAAVAVANGVVSNIEGGELDLSASNVTISNGGAVNNAGKMILTNATLTISDGGTLSSEGTLTGGTIELNQGGAFNVTKANKDGACVIAGNDTKFNLNGGVLQVAGKDYSGALTVGNESDATAMTISNGNYTFGDVAVAKTSTLTVNNGGALTVNDLKLGGNATVAAGGSLTVGGTLSQTAAENTLTVNLGGNLTTKSSNLFKKIENEDKIDWSKASSLLTANSYGNITVQDELTLSALNIRSAVSQAYRNANLMFVNVTVTDIDDVRFDKNFGLNYGTALINQTVTLAGDEVDVTHWSKGGNSGDCSKAVGVAKLNLADAEADSVSIMATKLILSGAAGNVVSDNVKELKITGELQLGKDANSTGSLNNVERLTVTGPLTVAGDFAAAGASVDVAKALTVGGKLTAKNVKVGADSTVKGTLAVDQIVSDSSTVTVNGTLSARYLGTDVTVEKGGELVIGKQLDKGVEAYAGNTDDEQTDGAVKPEQLAQIAGDVSVAPGAVVSTNASGKALAAAVLGSDADGKAVLYVDRKIALSDGARLTVGDIGDEALSIMMLADVNSTGNAGTVSVTDDAAVVIDVSAFGSNGVVFQSNALDIASGATFKLTNLTSEKSLTLVSGVASVDADPVDTHALLKGEVKENKLNIVFDEDAAAGDAETKDALRAALAEGANAKTQAVIAAVADTSATGAGLANEKGLTADGVRAVEEYFTAPVVAGVYNVAYDATAQVNATVARRNVENTTGSGVWADVFYTANKAKKAYGDQGYSADIYGGMLGVDTVFANGFKVGGAVTVGTGDADSERSFSKFSTDTDFYGVSLYAGNHMGDTSMYLSADASYLWADNDLKGSVAGVSASESLDSKVFTAGVRADWNVYESKALTVAPHVGVRYTSIDVDDYRGLKSDSMNIVEMPIGIKVAGNFEASGFKLTPAFDFTVVPEVGDKKVSTVIGDVDVINNLYNASLGVQAEMGNFSFGVNYKCGLGRDDRSNNSFNANVRYTF